jgi:monoamine oxidase
LAPDAPGGADRRYRPPMARTPLFDALRRALVRADAQRRGATPAPRSGPTRRQFLGTTAAALALPVLPSCSGDGGDGATVLPVVVVGGGIAGLHCAVRLVEAGVDVTVFEASGRTGGRMWTGKDLFADGQVCELGGELVDSGHTTIQGLCEELGLPLDDLSAGEPFEFVDIFFIDGQVIPFPALVEAFTPLAERMAATVTAAEADDAEFARIDAMSIPQWLEAEGLAADNVLRKCIEIAYVGEYGLEVDQQSVFNLLYLIDYEAPDPFRIYGDSDEKFHVHAGSQAIPDGLAARISDRIELEHVLTALALEGEMDDTRYRLTFEVGDETVEVRARHVVLALPFTALRRVDLTAAGLPAEKIQVIAELGYGTNSKLMLGFATRHWQGMDSNGGVFTNVADVQATWDTSRGQAGTTGILTNFVGGQRGVAIGEGETEARALEVVDSLRLVFPGIAKEYRANSAVRMHWPSAPHHLGSYACYKPGQWAFYGTEGARVGNLHFCGEHTSLDFQGYMEGGAETGALVALEILEDLGLPPPAQLRRLLAPKLRLPQAAYRGGAKGQRRGKRRALKG